MYKALRYEAAGEANPADLIRKVLKNSALSIENSGLKLRMEKVDNANTTSCFHILVYEALSY